MQNPGTQVVHRKKLAGAGAPPYVAEAEALLEKRDFQAALVLLETATREGRKPLEALLALAEAHWELVHPKESIDFLKEAIQLAPKDARPFAQLGRYLLYKGLRDQALNFLDRAIALDPNDPETKKLRERAALNKKKAYTVVANAADFTTALGDKKAQGATRMHKKEATRFLSIDPAKAAEELAKAERGAAEEMDLALAALLGADLLGVDAGLMKPEAATSSAGGAVRTIIAFLVVALCGLLVGGLAFSFGPQGAEVDDSVPALVARGTLSSLRAATLAMNAAEDTADNGEAALAYALLLVEHGGDLGQLERAEQLLAADAAERKGPAGLYARALLKGHPRAEPDPDLDEDIEKAAAQGDGRQAPWLLLAQAARAAAKGDEAAAAAALHKAAIAKAAPPRALHLVARGYARKGDLATAQAYLGRLHEQAPLHAPSRATAVVVDVLAAARAAEKGAKIERTKAEDDAIALFANEGLPALDAAELALVLAAVAVARGDDAGEMLQRASEAAKEWPGVVQPLASLHLLSLDVPKARDLLRPAIERNGGDIELLVARTRARVLEGLSEARVRQLKLSSTKKITAEALVLPVGKLLMTPWTPGAPLSPTFDPRFFPESAIKTALDVEGITSQAAERRLDVVARLELAELALAQGDVPKARDHVEAALEANKSDPEVHLVDALVKKRDNQREASRAAIEKALAVAPDDPRVLIAAARLHLDADDLRAARDALERVASEGYRSPAALALSALIALRDRDVAEARRVVDQALQMGPADLQVLRAHLLVARAAQDTVAARDAAGRMYQSSPSGAAQMAEGDPIVRAYLADVMARRGEEEEARDLAASAAQARPDDADVHLLRGDVLLATGRGDEAVGAFEKAAALLPDGPIGKEARRKAAKAAGKPVPEEEPDAADQDEAAEEEEKAPRAPGKRKGKRRRGR